MHHEELKQLLYGYVHNELNSEEIKKIEEHLASCPSCSGDLAELQKIRRMFGARESYVVSPWFSTQLMARICEEEASIWSGVEYLSKRFVVGFALLVLLLIGSSLLQREEPLSFHNYFAQASSPTEQTVLSGDTELSREDILNLALSGDTNENR